MAKFLAARQPILNNERELVGYELLFRDGSNAFPQIAADTATAKMIETAFFDMGFNRLVGNSVAFINFTEHNLVSDYARLLPPGRVVIEILESVPPSDELLQICKDLKNRGYRLALDDHIPTHRWQRFYPHIDIIKVDVKSVNKRQVKDLLNVDARYPNISLLAEKIETYVQYKTAQQLGFRYYQGFFFKEPEHISTAALNSTKQALLGLLTEVNKAEADLDQIVQLFESDPNLSLKLIRFTQSPLFRRKEKISTIRQAIVLLGLSEVRRLTLLLLTAKLSDHKPAELTRMAVIRAKLCETLADRFMPQSKDTAFLAGMLSLIGAMLDADLPTLIKDLNLQEDITLALVQRQGILAFFVSVCEVCEQGNWRLLTRKAVELGLEMEQLNQDYTDAIIWAETLFNIE